MAGSGGWSALVVASSILLTPGSAWTVARAQPLEPKDAPEAPERRAAPPPTELGPADADLLPFQERVVREIKLEGLLRTDRQLVENQIRSRAGMPLSAETVRGDVQRLNRLGRFRELNAKIQPYEDQTVVLIFEFRETPIITDVQAVGNRQIADSELAGAIALLKDTPVDEFQLGAARNNIIKLYREKGYYQATVSINQDELEKNNIVEFRINEGERVRVTDIRFEGNEHFLPRQLMPELKTVTAGIFDSGPVDNEALDQDVATLLRFYQDRGYLDVRADRQLVFSPNGREAIVRFLIEEGPLYTLRSVRVELQDGARQPTGLPPTVLSREQVAGLMLIKAGDVYGVRAVRDSIDAVQNAYAAMGYVDAQIGRAELRDPGSPKVDLLVLVSEGRPFRTGIVTIKGNELTQQKVIRRELEIKPDRPLDTTTERVGERRISRTERHLNETRLFEPGSVKLTVQDEDPTNPGYRDVLVEVKETNTGSLSFGAGISSDGGVTGLIGLRQRNFDIADTPDSFGELFNGRAFRGAGQDFSINLAPGSEVQNYSISLTEPSLFDSDYSGSVSGFYRTREYDLYNEDRLGGRLSVGRRFGERWVGSVNFRYDNVSIRNIDFFAPADIFDVQGNNDVTGLGFTLTRNTTDSRFRPTKGTRFSAGVERVGVLGGSFDFTKLNADYSVFLTVNEDFLGYKTVLSFKASANYIPEGEGDAPIFERYFLGGQSFRGYRFRSVSPKGLRRDGTQSNEPVGGTWSFFAGTELVQPIFKDVLSGAVFIDSGTVTNDIGFDEYRISAGFGLRVFVEQLAPLPFAFDFGFPILKVDGDRERVFSFSVDLPF